MSINRKASKVVPELDADGIYVIETEGIDPSKTFIKKMEKEYFSRRHNRRLVTGCRIHPTGGKECREEGFEIVKGNYHSSFQNFSELMNDEEFILEAVKLSPNPVSCINYFYKYVHPQLKKKYDFRLNFLKGVYLNEHVFKVEDINLIAEELKLEDVNFAIKRDREFKCLMLEKLRKLEGLNEDLFVEYKINKKGKRIKLDSKQIKEKQVNSLKSLVDELYSEPKKELTNEEIRIAVINNDVNALSINQ